MNLGRAFLSYTLFLTALVVSSGLYAATDDDVVVADGAVATEGDNCGGKVASYAKPLFAKPSPPSAEVVFSSNQFLSLSQMALRNEVQGKPLESVMSVNPFLRDIDPTHILNRVDIAIPINESFPLTAQSVRDGVVNGYYVYFPYQQDDAFLRFECPAYRAVIKFDQMKRILAKSNFINDTRKDYFGKGSTPGAAPKMRVTFNKAFRQVIEGITRARKRLVNPEDKSTLMVDGKAVRSDKTWVVDDVVQSYLISHAQGDAVSAEVWIDLPNETGQMEPVLAAGAIGLSIDGIYSGETLYMNEAPNPLVPGKSIGHGAGRVAMLAFLDLLEAQGVEFIDVQTVNESTGRIGADYVTRQEYLAMILRAQTSGKRVVFPSSDYQIRFDRWSKNTLQAELK